MALVAAGAAGASAYALAPAAANVLWQSAAHILIGRRGVSIRRVDRAAYVPT